MLDTTQLFIDQSARDLTSTHSISSSAVRSSRFPSSKSVDFDVEDFSQDKFHRCFGGNGESEQQREIWQYAKMMDTQRPICDEKAVRIIHDQLSTNKLRCCCASLLACRH